MWLVETNVNERVSAENVWAAVVNRGRKNVKYQIQSRCVDDDYYYGADRLRLQMTADAWCAEEETPISVEAAEKNFYGRYSRNLY